ncbi:MAG: hypothetical protein SFZ23_03000 [Planctomycetota bacterium]|nr:hypothetical protein [Planctomycetota bacterium]
MIQSPQHGQAREVRRAFSLVETTLASLLVAGLLVATLDVVAVAAKRRQAAGDRLLALSIAESVASEISSVPFADPQSGSVALTPDAGEANGTRSAFDNVGDFASYTESPCRTASGAIIAGAESWTLSVQGSSTPLSDLGAGGLPQVRFTITVSRGSAVLVELRLVRCQSVDQPTGFQVSWSSPTSAGWLPSPGRSQRAGHAHANREHSNRAGLA